MLALGVLKETSSAELFAADATGPSAPARTVRLF